MDRHNFMASTAAVGGLALVLALALRLARAQAGRKPVVG